MQPYAIDVGQVVSAAERIKPYVHQTQVMTCETIDRLAGRRVYLKCENLQKTGSFKYRGATNAVLQLSAEAAQSGVATHSSGNHAQALALAAKVRGIPAHIVMPNNAPKVKRQAVLDYGARVIPCEPTQAAREAAAESVVAETGATLIPPYDHPWIMAGQGTIALEFLRQVEQLSALIVPVGGGGMLAGCTVAAKALRSELAVYGAEPAGADDCYRSKRSGEWQPQLNPQTIADGLRTSLGRLTWPIIHELVDEIFVVTEAEIVQAMRLVWERMKLVIEPSAAVGVAVVLSEGFRERVQADRVGVILCGGNVSLEKLPW